MSSKARREVIAHFPVKRLLGMAVGWMCFIAIPLYGFIDEYRYPLSDRAKHMGYLIYCAFLLAVMLPVLPRVVRLLLGAALAGGAALWIKNGRLVYADRRLLDVPLSDIVSIDMVSKFPHSYGVWGYVESIFFRLANGKEAKVWAEFVENEGEVVAALQARLGLKVVGDMRSWH